MQSSLDSLDSEVTSGNENITEGDSLSVMALVGDEGYEILSCPGPGDPSNYTTCCYSGDGAVSCCMNQVTWLDSSFGFGLFSLDDR